MRPNGLMWLGIVVVLGMGSSSIFWHWQAPQYLEAAKLAKAQAEDPDAPRLEGEPRVEHWLLFGRPIVHKRLMQLRLDARRPWLVTHVVEPSDDPATHEIWGVDLTGLEPEVTRREGMKIVVELPAARLLGTGPLTGDKSVNVPRYRDGATPADPDERAEYVVEWALERVAKKGLEKDIEGATLEARVGRGAGPEEPR